VPLEFLLIHGFPLFVVASSSARVQQRLFRFFGVAAITALIVLYSLFAWGAGGP
jgi:hypothetical protein